MDLKLVNHPLHSKHPLHKLHNLSCFVCNRCKTTGSGTRYSCEPCKINLHLYCAMCPPNVLSSLHPLHKLTLYNKYCDSCKKPIQGLFYRCYPCNFDLHPLCVPQLAAPTSKSKLSSRINNIFHIHSLKLASRDAPFACGACKMPGEAGKRYSCEQCNFEIHPTCATCPLTFSSSSLHPEHELKLCWKRCNECGNDVEGAFYRCEGCDFDLHPLCHHKTIVGSSSSFWVPTKTARKKEEVKEEKEATRSTMYFFMHPEHDLLEGKVGEKAECKVCGEEVEGKGCYSCEECEFYVHKDCSKLRPVVRDMAHENHALHFQRSKLKFCAVCMESCVMWRYSCSACDVHVHKGCLKGHVSSTSSSSSSSSSTKVFDCKVDPNPHIGAFVPPRSGGNLQHGISAAIAVTPIIPSRQPEQSGITSENLAKFRGYLQLEFFCTVGSSSNGYN